ncbi:hypothetical protein P3T18_002915 [Paraburkholderia sp. GAS199]
MPLTKVSKPHPMQDFPRGAPANLRSMPVFPHTRVEACVILNTQALEGRSLCLSMSMKGFGPA